MKVTEILRLVWLNLSANKSKVILTSTGIIVGAATIMLVIAIGTGGKEEVAEQFKNLNAGAIDISYEYQGNSGRPGGGSGMPGGGGGMPGGAFGGSGGFSFGGGMFMMDQSQSNSERITLSESDMDELFHYLRSGWRRAGKQYLLYHCGCPEQLCRNQQSGNGIGRFSDG